MKRRLRLGGVQDRVLSTKAAAKLLDCHQSTIGELVRQRKLYAYKHGRGYVIPESCLQSYVNNPNRVGNPPPSPRELELFKAFEDLLEKYLDLNAQSKRGG